MKFCSYTNFDALFPSVVIDFPFLASINILRSLNLSISSMFGVFYFLDIYCDHFKIRLNVHAWSYKNLFLFVQFHLSHRASVCMLNDNNF